nr:immunoglobulin light chain junction region [Macaca mulatta]
CLQGYSVPWTF